MILWKYLRASTPGWSRSAKRASLSSPRKRDIFGFHPGDELLVLGDDERGIAILPKVMQREYMLRIFSEMDNGGDSK